jgi:hypothetical protein
VPRRAWRAPARSSGSGSAAVMVCLPAWISMVRSRRAVPVFVKVVEAKGSYAAGSAGSSGGLIQAASGS